MSNERWKGLRFGKCRRLIVNGLAGLLGLVCFGTTGAYTQGLPALFDAPWRGFDTGVFPDGFAPKTIAAGDIDGDGDSDVVAGNWFFAGSGISVLKNQGDGSYRLAARYSVPYNSHVEDVALVDFDGDGDLDVIGTVGPEFGGGNNASDVGLVKSQTGRSIGGAQ